MKIKLNRWEFDVSNKDWILDNGNCYQCMTIKRKGVFMSDINGGVPVKISKKRFQELYKKGLIVKDNKQHSYYDNLGCEIYRFNV